MKFYVRSLGESIDMAPVCGEYFCENCGDCLHCNEEFPCLASKSGEHYAMLEVPPDKEYNE